MSVASLARDTIIDFGEPIIITILNNRNWASAHFHFMCDVHMTEQYPTFLFMVQQWMSTWSRLYKCTYTLTSYTPIVRYLIIKNKTSNILESSTSKFRKLNLTTMVLLTIIFKIARISMQWDILCAILRCLYQLTISWLLLYMCRLVYKFVHQCLTRP